MEKQTKFYNVQTNAVQDRDSKKRIMTVVVSDETVNRYGHKVIAAGWNVKNYKKNPVVLINHKSDMLPIGKANRVWIDKKAKALMATIEFVPDGISPEADLAWALYDNDFMNSVSPGYLVDYETATIGKTDKDPKITFNNQELLEISLATVPANVNAVKQSLREQEYIQNALELGVIDEDLLDRVNEKVFNEFANGNEEESDALETEDDILEPKAEDVCNKDGSNEPEEEVDQTKLDNVQDMEQINTEDNTEDIADDDLDPFADFYKALDEINQEQKDNNDPDYIAGKIIESFESNDSNEDSIDDLDSWVGQVLS